MKGTVKALKNRALSAILACFIMIMPLAGIPASAADREFNLRVSSATAVPIKKETTGIKYLKAVLHSPAKSDELKSTILPVCAFANTPSRVKYVYAS